MKQRRIFVLLLAGLLLISTAGCGAKTTSPAPTEAPATASSAAAPSEPTPSSTSDADAKLKQYQHRKCYRQKKRNHRRKFPNHWCRKAYQAHLSIRRHHSRLLQQSDRQSHHRSNRNRSRRLRILLSRQPLCQQDRHRSLHSMWDIGWISPRPMPKASAWSWTVRP